MEVLRMFWANIGGVAVIFAISTFFIHLYDARLLNRWKKESEDAHKAQAEANKAQAESHRAEVEALARIEKSAEHIAELVVREGCITREAMQRS